MCGCVLQHCSTAVNLQLITFHAGQIVLSRKTISFLVCLVDLADDLAETRSAQVAVAVFVLLRNK